jgi:hypothetical protein
LIVAETESTATNAVAVGAIQGTKQAKSGIKSVEDYYVKKIHF